MKMKLLNYILAVLFPLLVACTDYEAALDARHEVWKTSVVPSSSSIIVSSSSVILSSSSKTVEIEFITDPRDGLITDPRDGQTYKTVKIGFQTWMAQNLNYGTNNSSCYKDSTQYCGKFGRFYGWGAAMDSAGVWSMNGKSCGNGLTCSPTYPMRGVCPFGWHLPTKAEFKILVSTVGTKAGKKLKSVNGWNSNNGSSGNGTDDYLFSALPVVFDVGGYTVGNVAYFWSSTEFDSEAVYAMHLSYQNDDAFLLTIGKNSRFSVR